MRSRKNKKIFNLTIIIALALSVLIFLGKTTDFLNLKNIFSLCRVSDFEDDTQDEDHNDENHSDDGDSTVSDDNNPFLTNENNDNASPSVDGRAANSPIMYVHVMNVGKADSIYIRCANKNILIDAGDHESEENIIGYLKRQGLNSLDLVVATHPHTDHIGGMYKIIENFHISNFLMPEIPEKIFPKSRSYTNMISALNSKNVSAQRPEVGKVLNVGLMKITILAPGRQYDDNMNNNSIVLLIKYGDKKFLFMGDAEKESEFDILRRNFDLKSDFIKIGHHGSRTSTTDEFLSKVSPLYAVISTSYGRNANFKNARQDPPAVRILNKYRAKIFRTDINGTIVFSSNGKNLRVKCQK
ncbi:MAG: MBL fold metallo-hydrolase [Oscillospiraceae bacterium]|nr:MBL fold metallo-hydrolase [Oscillospiraceae bacterium]